MALAEALVALLGALMVLIVPGWTWSLVLFPDRYWWRRWFNDEPGAWAASEETPEPDLDLVARSVVALGLSIVMAPFLALGVFWAVGVPFTPLWGWAVWLLVSVVPLVWMRYRSRLPRWQKPKWVQALDQSRDPPVKERPTPVWRTMAADVARQRVFLWIFAATTFLVVAQAVRIALDPFYYVHGGGRAGWQDGLMRGLAFLWVLEAAILLGARQAPAKDDARWTLGGKAWWAPTMLGGLVGIGWLLRWWPARDLATPLGYDYGYYKVTFDHFADAAPAVPLTDQPIWMQLQFPPGLPVLHEAMSVLGGISAYDHLAIILPVLSSILVLAFFVVARMYFGTTPALVSAALYTVSRPQLLAFELLYEKNVIAILLFLVMLVLIHRRHWLTAGVLVATLALYHRPMLFLVLATLSVASVVSIIRHRQWRGWAQMVGLGAAFVLPAAIILPETFLGMAKGAIREIRESIQGISEASGGTFLNRFQFEVVSYAYLPVGLAAAFLLLPRRAWMLRIAMLACLAASYLELIFHRRFLLMLDMIVILIAGAGLLMLAPPRWGRKGVVVVATMVLALAVAPTLHDVADQPRFPFQTITADQHEQIIWMRDNLPEDAVILTNNIAAPAVYAETGRTTYGPLLFGDPHSRDQWGHFLGVPDDQRYRTLFLEEYGGPLYLAIFPEHPPRVQWTGTFGPPDYDIMHETDSLVVVHFTPTGNVTA